MFYLIAANRIERSPRWTRLGDGIISDLTTLAKNLTGGMPGGAVAGIEPLMRLLDPAATAADHRSGVTHKGTFNGSPLIAAGAVAALTHLATGEHQHRADGVAARLRERMRAILDQHQVQEAFPWNCTPASTLSNAA